MTPALMKLMQTDRDFLTPEDIADILGSNPATIRLTVKEHPEWFTQYCPIWTGNRLKFPRQRFIWCMTGGEKV